MSAYKIIICSFSLTKKNQKVKNVRWQFAQATRRRGRSGLRAALRGNFLHKLWECCMETELFMVGENINNADLILGYYKIIVCSFSFTKKNQKVKNVRWQFAQATRRRGRSGLRAAPKG